MTLEWRDVVDYAFLTDFDLLRDTRQDILTNLWARPAGRMAMDLHFKLQRATEEIQRLNIEIPRVITYMRDEDRYLLKKQNEFRESQPLLSHQIGLYQAERTCFNAQHTQRFNELAKLSGFTSTILPGKRDGVEAKEGPAAELISSATSFGDTAITQDDEDTEYDAEQEDEEDAIDAGNECFNIMQLTLD
jgi:hypothetical protein